MEKKERESNLSEEQLEAFDILEEELDLEPEVIDKLKESLKDREEYYQTHAGSIMDDD
ncbi:MAG: hypothetical protein ACFFDB_00020 [Promethearchaeota archaeon]